jgi:hypothetical protein
MSRTPKKQTPEAPPPAASDPALEKAKRLEEYAATTPQQMTLFQFIDLTPQEQQRYSNTIELYDFMPKYHWGKLERIGGKFLDALEREFECRGIKYKIKVTPARIADKDNIDREYFPSKREELVEDALRRLATTQQGVFLDDMAGVTFTLYQLQQELKKNGHDYNKTQLKDALYICAKTSIEVRTEDGKAVLISNMFETLGLQTREDWEGTGAKTKAFVRFNSLVTASIKNGTYRQLNYKQSMSYKNVIARQLHKRMSHHYTQASIIHPYSIMLSTIIRDFGLTEYQWLSHNLRDVQKALEEMQEKNIILSYKIEKEIDSAQRDKLTDAKIIITPNPHFAGEAIEANARQKRIRQTLEPDRKTITGGK